MGHVQTGWFEASNIPDVKHSIEIYSNYNKGERTWIGLRISNRNEAKVNSDYRLSIESADWSAELVNVYNKKVEAFGSYLCKTDDLLGAPYIVNGKMTVKCEGILSVERKSDAVADDNKWRKNGFLGMTWNGTDTDFTIVVGEESLPVSFFRYRVFLFIYG